MKQLSIVFVNVIIYLRMLLTCPCCVADIPEVGEQFLERAIYLFLVLLTYTNDSF